MNAFPKEKVTQLIIRAPQIFSISSNHENAKVKKHDSL